MKQLYFGDCLDVLKNLYKKYPKGLINLVYIDPPFNSKRDYSVIFEDIEMVDVKAQKQAFADTWTNVSYLDSLNELLDIGEKDLYDFLRFVSKSSVSSAAYLTTMAIELFYSQTDERYRQFLFALRSYNEPLFENCMRLNFW